MPRILAFDNTTGSKLWRITPHLRELKARGWEVETISGKGRVDAVKMMQLIDWADVVLFQSVFDNRLADIIKQKGKKLIFEFDDLIDEVPANHPMADKVNSIEWRRQVLHVIEISDVIIVTNENLKARFFGVNHNIKVFPNYMDIGFWERPLNPNTNKDQIRLGWAGGISHQDDLEWIAPVVKRILDAYPQVKFIYCGDGGSYAQSRLTSFNYGKDHFVDVPPQRREYVMGSQLEMYPDKLNSLQLDIAIAPLVLNSFSACKTPIKWMEYAINKVPCVGQRFIYGQVITDGVNGFTATKQDEWFEKISKLVESAELRQKIGQQAYGDVRKNYDIRDHVDTWVAMIYS